MTGDVDARPLAGCRVVVTRQERGRLGDLLEGVGAEVVHVPLIEVVDAAGDDLERALDRLGRYRWLVVTSGEGADRVGRAASSHLSVRLAAVGTVTAERLAAVAGRPVDVVPERQLAAALVDEFSEQPPTTVLVAQADRAASTLVDGLRRLGHSVTAVTAYETRTRHPTPAEIARIAESDVVVFTSGSAAESWAEAMTDPETDPLRRPTDPPAVVAIGPTTDASIRDLGLKSDAVATDHSLHGLVDALIRLWSGSPSGSEPE
ncbi:MAG: uroporphyrinogen-III synthase [Actinomycetota bacterium]